MVKVGVIGLGMMGTTHLDVYNNRDDVEVVAVSDIDDDRLHGRTIAAGNVDGQAQGGFDFASVKKYDEGKKLIRNKHIELVDVCLPTPLHMDFGRRVLKAGKHLMVEKPVARTYREAKRFIDAAEKAERFSMVGQCIRFWPEWAWLKQAIDEQRYGRVLAAHFRRVSQHPGAPFYLDGEACGGALLDLHVHDVDFIQYCFGLPKSVSSIGYSKQSGAIDHVLTRYDYEAIPVVVAEGGWAMADGFGFCMQYSVNFERATVEYDMAGSPTLKVIEAGKPPEHPQVDSRMGYELEIDYLLGCIKSGRRPENATIASAAQAVKIAEAEAKSVQTGRSVKISA